MKQDGSFLTEEPLDIFTVEWQVYCDPTTVPTLSYGPYASVTSFYPDPSTNTDMVVPLTTFTVNPAMPCF